MQKLDAQGLLSLSLNTTSSPALRYAAAMYAMEIAADAGQTQVAQEAIRELVSRFAADELALGRDLIQRLAKADHPVPATILGCRYLDAALAAGRQNMATEIAHVLTATGPSLEPQLASLCDETLTDFRNACRLAPAKAPATAPATSSEYACLYQGRWDEQLPNLAGGSGELALLAKEDISATDLPSRMLAAERWWRAAQQTGGRTGWRIACRACAIYESLRPQVDGIQKALIASRMAEHQRQAMVHSGVLPGVIREIWKEGSDERNRQYVTMIALPHDAKVPELPKARAHVRFHGEMLIDRPGRYELTCIAGSGLRVKMDGKPLLDNPKAYGKRNGETLVMELSAGLHAIDIEVWSASSAPRLELQWTTPASPQKQPLPESVLFHDPLLQ